MKLHKVSDYTYLDVSTRTALQVSNGKDGYSAIIHMAGFTTAVHTWAFKDFPTLKSFLNNEHDIQLSDNEWYDPKNGNTVIKGEKSASTNKPNSL